MRMCFPLTAAGKNRGQCEESLTEEKMRQIFFSLSDKTTRLQMLPFTHKN